MFNMRSENYPSKPVVSSQSGAVRQFDMWLKANHYQLISDGAGVDWRLRLVVLETPAKDNLAHLSWDLRLQLYTKVQVADLVRRGTLDGVKDERLIRLLGENYPLEMHMRERHIAGQHLDKVRLALAEAIQDLRQYIMGQNLHDVKRQLCCQALEQQCLFENRGFFPAEG